MKIVLIMRKENKILGSFGYPMKEISPMDSFKKTIYILNSLIEINNSRIDIYCHAIEETEDKYLKSLFNRLAITSHLIKNDLKDELLRIGKNPVQRSIKIGNDFCNWVNRTTLKPKINRKILLNLCDRGEDLTQIAYCNIINNCIGIPNSIMHLIVIHRDSLRKDQNCVLMLNEFV